MLDILIIESWFGQKYRSLKIYIGTDYKTAPAGGRALVTLKIVNNEKKKKIISFLETKNHKPLDALDSYPRHVGTSWERPIIYLVNIISLIIF
ncbi:MAG: hypothetical protein Q7U47_00805 [Paludibacter sp.]|nr:hypothetical protein [Paludibacter sp.]